MEINNWKKILTPYTQAVEELKIKFKGIRNEYINLDEYSPIEFVTGRVKKISSILEKAKKKNIPLDQVEEKMEDIAGIRIMCQFVEDIYTVREIIRKRHGKDMYLVEERDYINNLKPSGYRSYHMIIKYPVQTAQGEKLIFAEIQIRTLAMNFWATIEHSLRYKYKQNMPETIQERLNKAAEAAHKLDQEMAEIRDEVLKAQAGFQAESNVVADIFGNVQALAKNNEQDDMNEIYEMFWGLWEEGNVDKLNKFNKELEEKIRQVYQR
ncbi:GTP pyrophosphokinase family protein [Niameybacter massiliensis]|uniref:GTP pyrophosphokinase family protein n=1 Tax=Holtiella tumoricola TaxID=3018743 RepID=A0AA42IYT9_9FIRM|nr:GTP pyrophosphokinase family protein [Niameybacter massiliensis]MDA3730189.1 GTP pyrophosphokinase family protein [Holtiella tumoricola]